MESVCRICGCTDDDPCIVEPEGVLAPTITCAWDALDPRLCTFCAETQQIQFQYQIDIALTVGPELALSRMRR
jgi:hypothetical protein